MTRLTGVLFAIAANGLFATSDTLVKLLSLHYPIFQIIAMQASVACVVVAIVIWRDKAYRLSAVRNPKMLIGRGFLAGVGTVSGFYAFSLLPLADVYAITFGSPLVVTVAAAWLLGERTGPARWIAILVGFSGILVMVQPGYAALSLGHLAAFLNVFVGASVILIMRTIGSQENRAIMVAAVMAGQLTASLPGLSLSHAPEWSDVGLVIVSGLVMVSAQFLMIESLRRAPASSVAPMQYTKLIWALPVGLFVFGDEPKLHVVAGALVVIGSVLYLLDHQRRADNRLARRRESLMRQDCLEEKKLG
ncbi:DMT family transporter [Microvirga lotononidis]|uniref:Putative permease n=1 Tax=Microvirga lotononidis TaxID=864069 RepID=I4YYK2_9HYPH|nr:DMT family transporter [Microvirga lotononidis]EIM29044.1 putative permease [Microvirga lotononidis]WQO28890.1 DMT family transporter [Microvirga lotononidis]